MLFSAHGLQVCRQGFTDSTSLIIAKSRASAGGISRLRIRAASTSVRAGVAKRRDWQRERMVTGRAAGRLVTRMKKLWSGGSSNVLSKALAAPMVMRSASSITQTSVRHEGTIDDLLFDLTHLFDLDLRRCQFMIRLNDEVIGVCPGLDLLA